MTPSIVAFFVGLAVALVVSSQGLLTKNGRNKYKEFSLTIDYMYATLVGAIVFCGAVIVWGLYGKTPGVALIAGYFVLVYPLCRVRQKILKRY